MAQREGDSMREAATSNKGRLAGAIRAVAAASMLAIPTQPATASELFSESVQVPAVQQNLFPIAATGQFTVDAWKHFHILLSNDPVLPTQDNTDHNTDPFSVNGTSTITFTSLYSFADGATGQWVGPGPIKLPSLSALNFSGTTAINPANIP